MKERLFTTKNMALMAIFSAIAAVLMILEFPIGIAPDFYKLDLSEIPILIGSFIMGPVAGVIMEVVKILLKLLMKPSSTAYVGELANFFVGCCLVVPASIIYKRKKTLKGALIGLGVGILSMSIVGTLSNYFIMIPFYSKFFKMPLDAIISMGTKINGFIKDKFTFVAICVLPFNLVKGVVVSAVTLLVYKRVSGIIKQIGNKK